MPTNRPLICLIGESGSGKTTLAETLQKTYNLVSVQSYTTRPKRHENETGHTFISEEEFDKLTDIVAYTVYNGYRYCVTREQINNSDVYVVDTKGLECLRRRIFNRKIIAVYVKTNAKTRENRMIQRGDYPVKVKERIEYDTKSFINAEKTSDCVVENNYPNDIQENAESIYTVWYLFGGYTTEEL